MLRGTRTAHGGRQLPLLAPLPQPGPTTPPLRLCQDDLPVAPQVLSLLQHAPTQGQARPQETWLACSSLFTHSFARHGLDDGPPQIAKSTETRHGRAESRGDKQNPSSIVSLRPNRRGSRPFLCGAHPLFLDSSKLILLASYSPAAVEPARALNQEGCKSWVAIQLVYLECALLVPETHL